MLDTGRLTVFREAKVPGAGVVQRLERLTRQICPLWETQVLAIFTLSTAVTTIGNHFPQRHTPLAIPGVTTSAANAVNFVAKSSFSC